MNHLCICWSCTLCPDSMCPFSPFLILRTSRNLGIVAKLEDLRISWQILTMATYGQLWPVMASYGLRKEYEAIHVEFLSSSQTHLRPLLRPLRPWLRGRFRGRCSIAGRIGWRRGLKRIPQMPPLSNLSICWILLEHLHTNAKLHTMSINFLIRSNDRHHG
jgi:hypothetical protein